MSLKETISWLIIDYKKSRYIRLIGNALIMALFIVGVFIITDNISAPYNWMASLFNTLCNISFGIIASCIFYFINIYLPEKAKEEEDAAFIASTLLKIKKDTLFHLLCANINYDALKETNPLAQRDEAQNPHTKDNSSINSEYELKANIEATIISVNNEEIRRLLVKNLAGAIKPDLVASFNGKQLQRHLLVLHSKTEIILHELKQMKKNNSRLATLILEIYPSEPTGFESATSYERQKVFLEMLPEKAINELIEQNNFPKKDFPEDYDYCPYTDPINPEIDIYFKETE